jgi:hypothetical protein
MNYYKIFIFISILFISLGCTSHLPTEDVRSQDDEVTFAFKKLTKSNDWKLMEIIDIDFQAFHTQGMVKIDNTYFVSAVEIIEGTDTYGETDQLWDFSLTRTEGKGRGWLFKFDEDGHLLAKVELTNKSAFHPGGIDFDGQYIWVPVAEYRPNSKTDIYRVDPKTMEAKLSFRVNDHIGSIIHNPHFDTFHGVSWGGRRLYEWNVQLKSNDLGSILKETWHPNPTHYIDYQDCQYLGINYMLCSGFQKHETPLGKISLGGIELIDISDEIPKVVHMLPVAQYWSVDITNENLPPTNAEMNIANNPFWVEIIKEQVSTDKEIKLLRFYFMPDSEKVSKLFIYDVSATFIPK